MRKLHIVLTTVVVAALVAACGAGASDDGLAGEGTTSDEVIGEAKDATGAILAGTDSDLPAGGPRAQGGKTVWALACSTVAPGCSVAAEGMVEAAQVLGWNTKLADGKLDPSVYNSQVRAAASAGADAIALFGVDCAPIKGAIEAAQKAGTKVFGANALDCDDKYAEGEGKPLFDSEMVWGPDDTNYGTYTDDYVGRGQADWIISKKDGKAQVIQLRQDDSAGTRHIGEAAYDRLSDCAGCKVTPVTYTGADLAAGKLQAKTSAAIQKAPDADVVMVPVDAAISLGVGAAVDQARATGRKLLLVGQEGVPASVKLVKDGAQSFALGRPWRWTGWAAVDAMNRMFAGVEPVNAGFGFGGMDADHLPEADVYDGNDPSQPYQANYKRIWGVS